MDAKRIMCLIGAVIAIDASTHLLVDGIAAFGNAGCNHSIQYENAYPSKALDMINGSVLSNAYAASSESTASKGKANVVKLTEDQMKYAKNFFRDCLIIVQDYEKHIGSNKKLDLTKDFDYIMQISSFAYHADQNFKQVTDFVFSKGALDPDIYNLMRSDNFSCDNNTEICKTLIICKESKDKESIKDYISFIEISGQNIQTRYGIQCVTPNSQIDESEIPYIAALFRNHKAFMQNTYAHKNRGTIPFGIFKKIKEAPVDKRLDDAVKTYFKNQ